MSTSTSKTTCPHCNADLRGEPIPAECFLHNVPSNPNWDPGDPLKESCEDQKSWNAERRCYCLPYGDKPESERFFSRVIGMEVRGVYDGVLYWQCPDCGGRWHRWPPGDRLHGRAEQYVNASQAHTSD